MKRFSIVNNGYNINEVNNFIDIVIKKLETLSNDNEKYLKELEELRKQVIIQETIPKKEDDTTNKTITNTLIAAQDTVDKMKELAKKESELIIKEAKENANAIIHEALLSAQKTEQEYELLKKNFNVYKAKVESLTKAQLELLKEIGVE